MIPCFLQHWHFEPSRPVYQTGGKKKIEVKAEVAKEDKDHVPELEFDPNKTTRDAVWKTIDNKYGKNAYETLIGDYVGKIMPSAQGDYKSALLGLSVGRYKKFYAGVRFEFMKKSDDLEDKFDTAVEDIMDKTHDDLGNLKSAVDGAKILVNFKEAVPSPKNHDLVEIYFEDYVEALNERYLNEDLDGGSDYSSMKSDFEDGMDDWMEAKLAWLLKNKGTKKSNLEAFRAEITARYVKYAKLDGNSALISSADLLVLNKIAKPPLGAVSRVLDEGDSNGMQRLEAMQIFNPDGWENTIEIAGNVIVQAAKNSGSEKDFVKAMRKYKNVTDFDDAVSEFNDKLDEISKVSVRETMSFLQQFNTEVHSDVLKFEKQVEPPSLAIQVSKQLDYLLSGALVPHKDTDKMLVRFMNANREGRDEILMNNGSRQLLFRAIALATGPYDEKFNDITFSGGQLNRSRRIAKTTSHDRAAQLKALIILGNQSKVIVSKLSKTPEHAGKKYLEKIEAVKLPEDAKNRVELGLRFKRPAKRVRFKSRLEQGGFNSRDLALKGIKMLGVLTVVSNLAQSYSSASGEDFPDKLMNALEGAATNHGLWIGAAATVGAHMAERHPIFLKYPWLSQYERAGAMTAFKLDNMGARLGRNGHKEVKRFLFCPSDSEWKALNHSQMTGDTIKELLKEKAKAAKGGRKPVITIKDISKIVAEPSILANLTRGGRSSRMRYLFYQKFFGSAVKPSVYQVKEHCTGSSIISGKPVKTA